MDELEWRVYTDVDTFDNDDFIEIKSNLKDILEAHMQLIKIRFIFSDNERKLYTYRIIMEAAIHDLLCLLRFFYFYTKLSFEEYAFFICDYKIRFPDYNENYNHLSICFTNDEEYCYCERLADTLIYIENCVRQIDVCLPTYLADEIILSLLLSCGDKANL